MDDLLKEAIADAKAVRETALENAKIALEEAFTPRLQSMLSKKIQSEMEDDEDMEDKAPEEAMHDEEEDMEDKDPEETMHNEERPMNDDDEDPSDDHSDKEEDMDMGDEEEDDGEEHGYDNEEVQMQVFTARCDADWTDEPVAAGNGATSEDLPF